MLGTPKKHPAHIGGIKGHIKDTKCVEKQTEAPLEGTKFFGETKELLARYPGSEGIVEYKKTELVQAPGEHGRHVRFREGATEVMLWLISRESCSMHPPKNLRADILR